MEVKTKWKEDHFSLDLDSTNLLLSSKIKVFRQKQSKRKPSPPTSDFLPEGNWPFPFLMTRILDWFPSLQLRWNHEKIGCNRFYKNPPKIWWVPSYLQNTKLHIWTISRSPGLWQIWFGYKIKCFSWNMTAAGLTMSRILLILLSANSIN